MTRKYILEFTDAQADVLIRALDAYSRLHMGQIGTVIDDVSLWHDARFKEVLQEFVRWQGRGAEIGTLDDLAARYLAARASRGEQKKGGE